MQFYLELLTIFAKVLNLLIYFIVWDFIQHIINPQWILDHGGLWLLLVIIFAETGLFLGFFLPGDSLLFVTGMTLSLHNNISGLNVWEIATMLTIAGILGNYVGYWFGKKSGPLLFKKKDSLLFKKKHLIAANDFYEKYGGGAIFLARFLPFIRTFAPIVAGIVIMDFKKFSLYNIIGCIAWVFIMTLSGYFLGKAIPGLEDHLIIIVAAIVIITTAPVLIKLLFGKKKKAPKTT